MLATDIETCINHEQCNVKILKGDEEVFFYCPDACEHEMEFLDPTQGHICACMPYSSRENGNNDHETECMNRCDHST